MARRVMVTGGARGIGQAIAVRFRQAGWEVWAPTRQELDLSDLQAARETLARLPRVQEMDALVHSAGINPVAALGEHTLDTWRQTLDVNLGAAFLLLQAVAPSMTARKFGRVLLLGSIFSHLARPGRAPYASAKAGLLGLARTAALELGPSGVLVNVLCPGFVDTALTRQNNTPEQLRELEARIPLGRLAAPAELAETAFFLCSEQNTYLTGQDLVVDGGFSIQ
jgi:3-oxoacyl-[acyl-carrier protein] reductase